MVATEFRIILISTAIKGGKNHTKLHPNILKMLFFTLYSVFFFSISLFKKLSGKNATEIHIETHTTDCSTRTETVRAANYTHIQNKCWAFTIGLSPKEEKSRENRDNSAIPTLWQQTSPWAGRCSEGFPPASGHTSHQPPICPGGALVSHQVT